jgi:SAM-dependent methyltransferase
VRVRVKLGVLRSRFVGGVRVLPDAAREKPAGWLLRARVRNDGHERVFRVSMLADGQTFELGWRGGDVDGARRLLSHESELVRVAQVMQGVEGARVIALARGRRSAEVRVDGSMLLQVCDDDSGAVVAEQPLTVGLNAPPEPPRLVFSRHPVAVSTPAVRDAVPRPDEVSGAREPESQVPLDPLRGEAEFFAQNDNAYLRAVGLGAIWYFQQKIARQIDMAATIRRELGGGVRLRGLTLACGDMAGEYAFLRQVGVSEIDAWDISEGQRVKFYDHVYDGEIPVNYSIGDVNKIALEPGRYDVVYLQHAYHHVEALEHVADHIAASLRPGGVFALVDYVGANFLQRTPRQREICGALWKTLPARVRVARNGSVVEQLRIPPRHTLPPYEAVRSEDILGVLHERFTPVKLFLYGGLINPIFNGFAHLYTDSEEDKQFIRMMWELDQALIRTGGIEPDFIRSIWRPAAPTQKAD